jgi:hypothetical protein
MEAHEWSQLWIAVVVALSSTLSPLLLAWLVNRNSQSIKAQDWARQDVVAAKAAHAAELLLNRQNAVAKQADLVATTLQASNVVTNTKLDVIHTLVNSNMTAAMQAELTATERELAMMKEVGQLNQAAGREPSVESLAAIKSTQDRIGELQAALEDRLRPQH